MKNLMLVAIFISSFFSSAYALETETECPYMRESTTRNNPKANLAQIKGMTKDKATAIKK